MFGDYVIGKLYNRKTEIHDRFGGSRQSGISPSANHPVVFIFTGASGARHGYDDDWDDNGNLRYFGQGQVGDMEFIRGNSAIRDHSVNGKQLLVFQVEKDGVRFRGAYVCSHYELVIAPDTEGTPRQAIVFTLVPEDSFASAEIGKEISIDIRTIDITSLRNAAYNSATPSANSTINNAVRTVYERSANVREYVLARAKGKCEGCCQPAPFLRKDNTPYLEPHHIRRVSDGGPDHPRYVIALCPNCHREAHFGSRIKELQSYHLKIVDNAESTDFEAPSDQL
jgi:5-methylcytosine-specific restriction protein A